MNCVEEDRKRVGVTTFAKTPEIQSMILSDTEQWRQSVAACMAESNWMMKA